MMLGSSWALLSASAVRPSSCAAIYTEGAAGNSHDASSTLHQKRICCQAIPCMCSRAQHSAGKLVVHKTLGRKQLAVSAQACKHFALLHVRHHCDAYLLCAACASLIGVTDEVWMLQGLCTKAVLWAGVQDPAEEVDSLIRLRAALPYPLQQGPLLPTCELLPLKASHICVSAGKCAA